MDDSTSRIDSYRITGMLDVEALSEYYEEIVTLVFAVVVAQSLNNHRDLLFKSAPLEQPVAFFGLIGAYAAIVLSWIGYHNLIVGYPYVPASRLTQVRLVVDLTIVGAYSFLLQTINWLGAPLTAVPPLFSLDVPGRVFYSYVFILIFILYSINDFLVKAEHGSSSAGHLSEAGVAVVLYILIIAGYFLPPSFTYWLFELVPISPELGAVTASVAIMIGYRYRIGIGPHKQTVIVDVDGVLADHIPAVLSQLNNEAENADFDKTDVTEWAWSIPDQDRDIDEVITEFYENDEFVLGLPWIENAVIALEDLEAKGHAITIATNRPEFTEAVTKRWLADRSIEYDRFELVEEDAKAALEGDILIDDSIENIQSFASDDRIGILFQQPWNQEFQIENSDSVYVAQNWKTAIKLVDQYSMNMLK